jgi:hypothetical protein
VAFLTLRRLPKQERCDGQAPGAPTPEAACRRCRRTPAPPAVSAGDLVDSLPLSAPARSPGACAHALPSVRAADCSAELLCLLWCVSAVRHQPLTAARGRRAVHGRTIAGANALEFSMPTRSSLPLAVCSPLWPQIFFSLPAGGAP